MCYRQGLAGGIFRCFSGRFNLPRNVIVKLALFVSLVGLMVLFEVGISPPHHVPQVSSPKKHERWNCRLENRRRKAIRLVPPMLTHQETA